MTICNPICILVIFCLNFQMVYAQGVPEVIFIKDRIENNNLGYQEKNDFLDSLFYNFDKNEKSQETKSIVYYQLGYQYNKISKRESAIGSFQKSLIFADQNNLLLGKANWKLGQTFVLIEDNNLAIDYFRKAIHFLKNEQSKDFLKYLSYSYQSLGEVYQKIGDYKQAENYYLEAKDLFQFLENNLMLGYISNCFGSLSFDKKEYKEALIFYNFGEQTYKEEKKIDVREYLQDIKTNKANVFHALGRLRKAKTFYHSVLNNSPNKMNDLTCKENLGIIYRKLMQLDSSLYFLNKVLQIKKDSFKKKSHPEFASIFDNIGDVFFDKKDYHKALNYYNLAIQQVVPEFRITNAQYNAPNIITQHLGPSSELLNYLNSKAKTLSKIRKFQTALDTYKIADELVEQMRILHKEEASKLFWRRTTRPIYEGAIKTSFFLDDAESAFYFMEKSKAVLLADALNEQQAKEQANIPREIIKKIKDLQGKIAATNDMENRKNYLQYKEELYKLISSLEKEYPAYYQFKYNKNLPTIKIVQEKTLDDTTSFIGYFVTEDNIFALNVNNKNVNLHSIPFNKGNLVSLKKMLELAGNQNLLETKYKDSFFLYNQSISKLLWEPLKNKSNRHIIAPVSWLNYLNFEMLLDEDGNYLIEKHTFNYVYSATVLQYAMKEKSPAENQFLGIAPKHFVNLPSLENSEKHLSAIHNFVKGDCLKGKKSNRKNLLKKLTENYRVVHFFTHAQADSINTPFIALADERFLLPEIYLLNFNNTELVTLSACQSAVGKLQEGEGVMSLARACTYAGASCVVASQWKVEEKVAREQMTDFYKFLAQDMPKDEALRQAKLLQLKLGEPPSNWAAFISIGDTAPIVGLKAKSKLFNWFILIFFFLVSAFLLKKSAKI